MLQFQVQNKCFQMSKGSNIALVFNTLKQLHLSTGPHGSQNKSLQNRCSLTSLQWNNVATCSFLLLLFSWRVMKHNSGEREL